ARSRPLDTLRPLTPLVSEMQKAGEDILSRLRVYSRHRPTLPYRSQYSTIGPGGLTFRVRNGNGCGPSGKGTGNPRSMSAAAPASRAAVDVEGQGGWGHPPGGAA